MDAMPHRSKRRGEDLFGLIMLALSIALFWQSYEISGFSALSSPGAFPMAASGAMIVAALVVVWGDIRNVADRDATPVLPATVALFGGLVALYAALLTQLGFLPASFLFLFAGMKLLHRRGGWLGTGVIALAALVAIYVVFRLVFQVVLPEGIVPEREIIAAITGLFGGREGAQ